MEGLFGPDAAALKGKTTRTTPAPVVDDRIDLPLGLKARSDIVLTMDIMFIQGIPMLTTIDRSIKFRGLVPLASRSAPEIYARLDAVLRL